MSGFFKKLFNRITGKKDEPAPEAATEQVALPAPDAVQVVAAAKPARISRSAKPVSKKPLPKQPAVRTATSKKTSIKTTSVKKPIVKPVVVKAKSKPAAAKKVEVRKPVSVKKPPLEKARIIAPPLEKAKTPPPPIPVIVAQALPVPAATTPAPAERKGWFSRLAQGLSKSSKSITGSITAIFTKRKLDKETLQELEDTLIQADLGLAVAERIVAEVSHGRFDKEIDPEEVKQILAAEVAKVLKPVEVPFNFGAEKPFVILVVGVNGSGKTTTIGKLGAIAAREGFKIKFAACDTFRAAAIEQLTVWGKRIGVETISRPQGADAAGLAFDAMKAAREDGTDILFIDTAGRLHNKTYLMDELDKVVRVIKKYDAAAPHAVLLVLDATTGQNALAQAEAFTKVAGVTGLIMTKLDGTARGGILVAIAEKFKLPIHAIGVGESIEDLQAFDAEAFARAIAGLEDKI
jgi:fused signal recognition particle receptor